MSAGVSATSCREQPGKVMETMRRWTRHAVWQGGPAADYRLLLWLGVVPARADPVLAVLVAAARTVSLLIQDGHVAVGQLSWLWLAADKANPVAALRQALQRAGIAGDLETWRGGSAELRNPPQEHEGLRARWLMETQQPAGPS